MIDPITEKVISNYLLTVAEEMGIITMRTARSNVIKEGGDFSTALYDWQGRLAQHGRDMPAHQGLFPTLIKRAKQKINVNAIEEGDIFLTNDEEIAGSHLNDVKMFAPVFFQDEIVMWVANLSHWPDIGGAVPGSYFGQATEIYQEGLQIPLIKIAENWKLRDDVVSLIMKNVRGSKERQGDIRAQLASIKFAANRITEIFRKYGKETIFNCFESLIKYSESQMRKEIEKIPDGSYEFTDYMDNDGVENRPVKFHARIKVNKDRVSVDFSKCDKNVRGPINSPLAQTYSAVYYAIRVITDHTIPPNEGLYRSIEIITEPDSVVDASPVSPRVFCTHETSTRLVDVCLGALAKAVPEKVPAAGYGSSFIMIIGGKDPRTSEYYTFYEPIAGGFGARPTKDGIDGTRVHMGNTANTPIEVFERDYPLVCEKYEYITDSCGSGEFRGGLGVKKVVSPLDLETNEPHVTSVSDRNNFAPYGLDQGLSSITGRFVIKNENGEERPMPGECPGKTTYVLKEKEQWAAYTPGGGGYGNPLRRDPEKVLWDVIEEKVSLAVAERDYGVIINSDSLTIDFEETKKLRNRLLEN